MITFTSACKTDLSKTFSSENSDIQHFRDPSFSSYLNGSKQAFVFKKADSAPKKTEDGEIDVFAAEKYFNEGIDQEISRINLKKEEGESVKTRQVITKPPLGAPSIRSESSCNSQNAFLHRNQSRGKTRKNNAKCFLASLACNCSCGDKNSVEIDDQSSVFQSKIATKQTVKINTSPPYSSPWVKGVDEHGVDFNFNSKEENRAVKSKSPVLEKRSSMLNWGEEIEIPEIPNGVQNDAGSDASSDLFEIESFANSTNSYLVRQPSPSEASVEWSVITASAADFSAMSETAEIKATSKMGSKPVGMALNAKNKQNTEIQKPRSGILSGCSSHKAVRVAGESNRVSEKAVIEATRKYDYRS